ncbi:long-chain-fatty-acid--ligase 5 [Stylonychia lemnae]|uniref:Long-chain-fatty-acid--ligase 5 n=1 Tax=Stylonychia lemnae TaxID=5949 RepID=A0A078AFJ7_STYLE|nr:long-chain-fatty-acid--ligase 5 [Stylonychia lemnae]|eukprot:CDW80980.1 long-chain-fatty-acid--ligase 5 [Stylonychia lemnae]
MGNNQQLQRNDQYALFREDIPKKQGYSNELICIQNKNDPDKAFPKDYYGSKTLLELFEKAISKFGDNKFLGSRNNDKAGRPYEFKTFKEVAIQMDDLAQGILNLNLSPVIQHNNENWRFMGIFSRNREEWALVNLACMKISITVVPFFDSLGQDSLAFVINQTELTTMCIEEKNFEILLKLKCEGRIQSLQSIVMFDKPTSEQILKAQQSNVKILQMSNLVTQGQQNKQSLIELRPKSDSIYMFCYTSGTTGGPKAAMISHYNLLGIQHQLDGDPLQLLDDLKALKPTHIAVVPRILTRIYQRINDGVRQKGGCSQYLFKKAVNSKVSNYKSKGEFKHKLYDKILFKKIQALFGGNLKTMMCGSAAVDPKILIFFKIALGINVYEGYAQTETSLIGTTTTLFDRSTGHVGSLSDIIKARLKDVPEMNYYHTDLPPRGELQIKCPGNIKGYFKDQEKSIELYDEDGWLNTGDVVSVSPNGNIQIIDRAKNLFKLSQGEYIAPEKLQNLYSQAPIVQQIYIHGESSVDYIVAVIVPDPDQIKKFAQSKELSVDDYDTLLKQKAVKDVVLSQLNALAIEFKFSGLEKVKKVHLTSIQFNTDNDLATPTLKVKRFNVRKYFQKEIEQLYNQNDSII